MGCYRQAVLVIRWYLDGTRLAQLAIDNTIGSSTAYRYLHEGIDVLACCAPGLSEAIAAAKEAGHGASEQVAVPQHQFHLDVCRVRSHADMAPMEMASNVTLPAMSST